MNAINIIFLTLFLLSVLVAIYFIVGTVVAMITKKHSLFHLVVSATAIIAINTIVKLLMYFDR